MHILTHNLELQCVSTFISTVDYFNTSMWKQCDNVTRELSPESEFLQIFCNSMNDLNVSWRYSHFRILTLNQAAKYPLWTCSIGKHIHLH